MSIETNQVRAALLTTSEAARVTGRDPRTIRRWVTEGVVPDLGVVIGGRVYVRWQALEELAGTTKQTA